MANGIGKFHDSLRSVSSETERNLVNSHAKLRFDILHVSRANKYNNNNKLMKCIFYDILLDLLRDILREGYPSKCIMIIIIRKFDILL
ncbi:MAG: hypothetical protein ACFFFT_18050 [Candidatus Thorarchaeota archaeon]